MNIIYTTDSEGQEESATVHHGHSVTAQEENEYDKRVSIITANDISDNVHHTTNHKNSNEYSKCNFKYSFWDSG